MSEFLDIQHRLFIQAFMWKKSLPNDEVRLLHQKCHDVVHVPVGDLKAFIQKINSALLNLNMALDKGVDELTGKDYLVLVNMTDTSISRLTTEYNKQELELFKQIINCIVTSHEGKVSTTTILNLSDEVKISKREIEEILAKFTEKGWLNEKNQCVFFTTRAMVELKHFFRVNYAEQIYYCFLCKNVVFQGSFCQGCEKKLHNPCKEKYFFIVGSRKCPACNNEFGTAEDEPENN